MNPERSHREQTKHPYCLASREVTGPSIRGNRKHDPSAMLDPQPKEKQSTRDAGQDARNVKTLLPRWP